MTAPWSLHHKWWKKCLPWYLYQKPDLKRAALIHCTTDLEEQWNHALGFPNTFIVPLGTTLPHSNIQTFKHSNDSTVDLHLPPTPKTLLYVGRIYPVKALDNAIRAVVMMKKDVVLRIVGPDQAGHLAELVALCDQLHLPYVTPESSTRSPCSPKCAEEACFEGNIAAGDPKGAQACALIEFAGPEYDADLSAEYANCDALILVSHTENFGATVVDAMAHGKPVITSTNTPWKIVQGNSATQHSASCRCGWWVDNDPESLACAFDEFASTSTSDLNLLGQNGLALVKQFYTWPAIAKNLIAQYERIIRNV